MKRVLYLVMAVVFLAGCCKPDCLGQEPDKYLYADPVTCDVVLPDYRELYDFTDNCAVKDTIQLPAPGTILNVVTNPQVMVEIVIRDYSDNIASTSFRVILLDTVPPKITPKTIAVGNFDEYDLIGGNKRRASPMTMRGSGMLVELSGKHQGYADANMMLAMYSDTDGKPDKLMAVTGEVKCNTTEGWQVASVLEPIRLNEGQEVWVAFMTDQIEDNEGFYAAPTEVLLDVSSNSGEYTSGMPLEFGESTQWKWGHNVHFRYSLVEDKPVEILAMEYKEIERYIYGEIADYIDEFPWDTYEMDPVLGIPKAIAAGCVIE